MGGRVGGLRATSTARAVASSTEARFACRSGSRCGVGAELFRSAMGSFGPELRGDGLIPRQALAKRSEGDSEKPMPLGGRSPAESLGDIRADRSNGAQELIGLEGKDLPALKALRIAASAIEQEERDPVRMEPPHRVAAKTVGGRRLPRPKIVVVDNWHARRFADLRFKPSPRHCRPNHSHSHSH